MKAKIIMSLMLIVALLPLQAGYYKTIKRKRYALNWRIISIKQWGQDVPDILLKEFIKGLRARVITTSETWYIIKQSRKNGINPLVGLALCQKESSLLEGGTVARKNKSLAMGYWPENKKVRGYWRQVWLAMRCLRRHYETGKNKNRTFTRLQDKAGYIYGLNSAEYSLFCYNPVLRGNSAFSIIFKRYARIIDGIYYKNLDKMKTLKIGWELLDETRSRNESGKMYATSRDI
jgi:hypothetical protein